jgi:hypothetical protein
LTKLLKSCLALIFGIFNVKKEFMLSSTLSFDTALPIQSDGYSTFGFINNVSA